MQKLKVAMTMRVGRSLGCENEKGTRVQNEEPARRECGSEHEERAELETRKMVWKWRWRCTREKTHHGHSRNGTHRTGQHTPAHVKWFAISLRWGERTHRVMNVPRKKPVSSADAVRA